MSATERFIVNGNIEASCVCGDTLTVPDKGLGRANYFAWLTRHQTHSPDPAADPTKEGEA